jgi:hypothetical protein
MMGLLKEEKVRHEEDSRARGTWSQQRARAEGKWVERHCEALVELALCFVLHHDRQNPTIDSPIHPRHCEARSAVTIQIALQLALSFGVTDPPSGLPRRGAPRKDEGVE